MADSDANMILRLWKEGDDLSSAWFQYATSFEADKYRNARDIGASQSLQMLMSQKLFDQIANNDLIAIGFQTKPSLSDGPIEIPNHCFMRRPDLSEIDDNIIHASGWRYERVRVSERNELDMACETQAIPQPNILKAGRPNTYSAARKALLALHNENPALVRQSAARLLERFNQVYPNHASSLGLPCVPLSERTLRDHLKRFRQKLEETGNNKSSN